MYRAATEPNTPNLQGHERIVAEQNAGATLAMWTGLGSILCLLLSCFLGSLQLGGGRLEISVAILAVLLIASVILYFLPAKRDERWYLVCSLLNHAGIGLAVLLLLDLLGLEIRLLNLAASGLPAAAILFGTVMFYLSAEERLRGKLLWWGLGVLAAICAAAGLKYYFENTEFWLCTAICALLSCSALGALIWANKDPENRSVYQGLAVGSFSIYLLLLVAAAVALILAASGSGSSNRSSRNKKGGLLDKLKGSGDSANGGSGSLLGGLFGVRSTRGVRRRRGFYFPSYLWYYTPYTRYAAINRMAGMSDPERELARERYRRRRMIMLAVVAVIVVAVIGAAVVYGGR